MNMQINKYCDNLEEAVDVLARTIYGEARGELVRGKEAVASVVINRVDFALARGGYWWGNDVVNVCLRPWQFSCWNPNDPNRDKVYSVDKSDKVFGTCLRVARRAINGSLKDPTGGATHYHAKGLMPDWALHQVPCAEIGHHVFYKDIL